MAAIPILRPWAERYVGLPWLPMGRDRHGVDCWGLVRLVLWEQRGIKLPMWDTVDPSDGGAIADTVAGSVATDTWHPVQVVVEFDFALMRAPVAINGRTFSALIHVGIVAPGQSILHVQEGDSAVLQPIAALHHRIAGFYRHKRLL